MMAMIAALLAGLKDTFRWSRSQEFGYSSSYRNWWTRRRHRS